MSSRTGRGRRKPKSERVDLPELPPLVHDETSTSIPEEFLALMDTLERPAGSEELELGTGEQNFALEITPENALNPESEPASELEIGALADLLVEAPISSEQSGRDAEIPMDHSAIAMLETSLTGADDGAEGPERDEVELPTNEEHAVPSENSDDEGLREATPTLGEQTPPAFRLASVENVVGNKRLRGPEELSAMAVCPRGVLLIGTDVAWLPRESFDQSEPTPYEMGPGPEGDTFITSVVWAGARSWFALDEHGALFRTADDGRTWQLDEGPEAPIAGLASTERTEPEIYGWTRDGRLFVRHASGWSSLPQEGVRGLVSDAGGKGLLGVVTGWPPWIQRWDSTRNTHRVRSPGASPIAALACHGELWVLACASGSGFVSLDGGEHFTAWPLLECVTALAVISVDDGAMQIVAATYDPTSDRSCVWRASLQSDGTPKNPASIATLGGTWNGVEGEERHRVEQLLPLDRAGQQLLVLTPGATWLLG